MSEYVVVPEGRKWAVSLGGHIVFHEMESRRAATNLAALLNKEIRRNEKSGIGAAA